MSLRLTWSASSGPWAQVGETAQEELKPALVDTTLQATEDLTVSTGEFSAAAIEAESAAMAEAAAVEEAAAAQETI